MTEPRKARSHELVALTNALLFIVFCVLAGTGLALVFRLDYDSAMMLGTGKRTWARIHALTAMSFLSLVAIHLGVHWAWLRGMLARLRWPTVAIVVVGLAVLLTFLLAPVR